MVNNKELKLNVAEAYHNDIGSGVVRLDFETMKHLNLNIGDYVLISNLDGSKKVIGKVWRANLEDEGLGIVRIDSIFRRNLGVSLSDEVKVKNIEVKPATKIEIAPLEEDIKFSGDPTNIFHQKLLTKGLVKGNIIYFNIMGNTLHYVVTKTMPKRYVFVNQNTKIIVSEKKAKISDLKISDVSYEDIGGLKEEIEKIREMVEIPMKHPEVFERLGIKPPKGVLLYGPPGTGKTLLAKAVANEVEAQFFSINGPEIMSKYYGESEKHLRDIFEKAEEKGPSIIFIDEIDSIAPNRENTQGEVERRVVSQLLTLMDGLKGRGNVVVIAATNRPNSIDPALRRPGRFDREISINPPTKEGRREILEIHTRGMPLDDDVNLNEIAEKTHGFTGADLEVLTKEAAMNALKKYMPDLIKFEEKVPTNVLESIKVKKVHFENALNRIEPSAMREVLIRKPNVTWEDVGGLDEVKEEIKNFIELPLKQPELFKEAGITAPKGILFSGPPGTGKTLIAKAVANESEANFISIKGPELISKWVGESEKAIRDIFKKAKQVSPTIIFFDEFDSIASTRTGSASGGAGVNDKIVNQLLTELDGVEELTGVTIIAATNRADLIDEALKRPGRLDTIIEFGLPDEEAREEIFKIHTKRMPLTKDVDIKKLAKLTEGFSGADIAGVCQKVGLLGIKNREKKGKIEITQKMFEEVISDYKERKK